MARVWGQTTPGGQEPPTAPAGRSARQLPGAKDNMIDSRPSSARQASKDGTAAGIPCFPRYWRQRKSIWDAGVVAGRRHRSYSRITLEVAPVPLACDRNCIRRQPTKFIIEIPSADCLEQ